MELSVRGPFAECERRERVGGACMARSFAEGAAQLPLHANYGNLSFLFCTPWEPRSSSGARLAVDGLRRIGSDSYDRDPPPRIGLPIGIKNLPRY